MMMVISDNFERRKNYKAYVLQVMMILAMTMITVASVDQISVSSLMASLNKPSL